MKPPICWRSFVFAFHASNDIEDHYSGDGFDGRLCYSRSQNLWLAALHGAVAVRNGGPDGAGDSEAARRAVDAALLVLRARVASDQAFLTRVEEETG